ncbi:MAG: DUF3828 domain-containing protein [Acidobacteriota bacterium]
MSVTVKNRPIFGVALVFTLIVGSYISTPGQTADSPEGRTRDFYTWYLKALVKKQDRIRNRTIIKSHLSTRFSRWLYSKAGKNLVYDVFVGSPKAVDGTASFEVDEAFFVDDNTAALHIVFGDPPNEDALKLLVTLVKEGGKWKIDRVNSIFD